MGEHTEKQFVYLRQKLGRNTHPERKGMGILSNKEECSKSEARQRDFPGGPVVKTLLPLQGARVPSLVGELRSPMARPKKKKKKEEEAT